VDRPCKICETCDLFPNSPTFPDVCEFCARYDWGHWHIRKVHQTGFAVGAILAAIWWVASGSAAQYAHPFLLTFFVGIIGGFVGQAVTDLVTDRVFHRMLVRTEPSRIPEDRAREAEKFFYISMLSAYQGKVRFAIDMLQQARRHGWQQWERLTNEPHLRFFSKLPQVKAITGHPA
jgi:hypothetical protein